MLLALVLLLGRSAETPAGLVVRFAYSDRASIQRIVKEVLTEVGSTVLLPYVHTTAVL